MNTDRSNAAWRGAARALLARFSDRDLTILEGRVLGATRPRRTLQELGDTFCISRERVRQIEDNSVERLHKVLQQEEHAALRDEVLRFCTTFGRCFPADALERNYSVDIEEGVVPLEEELLLFLAGPYRLDNGWFIAGSLDEELSNLIAGSAEARPLPIMEAIDLLEEFDVRPEFASDALARCPRIRRVGDVVVRWDGTLADKAVLVLYLEDRPMLAEEIHSAIGTGQLTTLKNYLGADSRFLRRGMNKWGLSAWGGAEYTGIADAMAMELKRHGGASPVERLKRVLQDQLEISAASVELMSATHPRFVRDGAWVRLRQPDEPYIPDSSLEECRGCYEVGGRWALRAPVDHDILRGSGRPIPEPFAVHLGVFYGSQRTFTSEFQTVKVGWPAQQPSVGSLRVTAEALGAEEGDHLFVIAESDSEMCFRLLRRRELEAASPTTRLVLLVGAGAASTSEWRAATASALGLAQHAAFDEIQQLLAVRREHELRRLFQIARNTTPSALEVVKQTRGDETA